MLTKILQRFSRKGFTVSRANTTIQGSTLPLLPDDLRPWENSAFAACLSSAMDAFIEAEPIVELFDGKDWNPEPTHPLQALLEQPNPYYDGTTLFQGYILSMAVSGNGYFFKVRNGFQTVQELWHVPHFDCEPVTHVFNQGYIDGYRLKFQGATFREFPREDVVHVRWGLDPDDTRLGLSPYRQALRSVGADNQADQYCEVVLRKRGIVGLFVSPKGDAEMELTEAQEFAKRIDREYTGEGRGKSLVATRDLSISTPGANPKDMDLGTMGKRAEERISGILNTPAIIAGLGAGLDRSTFANMEEAQKYYTHRFLLPRWRQLERALTHQLIPEFHPGNPAEAKKRRVRFDVSNVAAMQVGLAIEEQRIRENWKVGGYTHGEFRQELKKNPEPGLEDLHYWDLFGTTPASQQAAIVKAQVTQKMRQNRAIYEALESDDPV